MCHVYTCKREKLKTKQQTNITISENIFYKHTYNKLVACLVYPSVNANLLLSNYHSVFSYNFTSLPGF